MSPKYAQNELASLWPKQKGVKSCATVKSSNKIAKSYCTLRQPPQSPLRRALRLVSFKGSVATKYGCTVRGRLQESKDARCSVISSWWSVSYSEQCRDKTGRHHSTPLHSTPLHSTPLHPRQRKSWQGQTASI